MEAARLAASGVAPESLPRFRRATETAAPRPARRSLFRAVLPFAALLVAALTAWGVWSALPQEPLADELVTPPVPPVSLKVEPQPVEAPRVAERFAVVLCECRRPEEVRMRDAFLAARLDARALRLDDPAVEQASAVFAIGGPALDVALALPGSVPIVFTAVPGGYARPRDRRAVELGAPTREQLEEIDRRLPRRRRVGIVVGPEVPLDAVVRASQDRASPLVRMAPPTSVRDLHGVVKELTSIDVLWVVGVEGPVLEAIAKAAQHDAVPVVVSGVDGSGYGAVLSFVSDPIQLGQAAAVAATGSPAPRVYVTHTAEPLPQPAPVASAARPTPSQAQSNRRAYAMIGASGRAKSVPSLCLGLRQPEPEVRIAAAHGLASLGQPTALSCLRKEAEADPAVEQHIAAAIVWLERLPGWRLRVRVEGEDGVTPTQVSSARGLLDAYLSARGVTPTDDESAPVPLLEVQLTSEAPAMIKASVMLRARDGLLLDNWNPKVNGGLVGTIDAVIPKVVEIVAKDLGWGR
ncbi:MAG: hypothetical protein JNK82_43705 [Myxococcaceae bacterium]|nr:hypothetical protein [Myxococcaceae bacterium]